MDYKKKYKNALRWIESIYPTLQLKEDKYNRNPQYIKQACYDGQGLFIS